MILAPGEGEGEVGQWVYAVAASFATISDTVTLDAVQAAWLSGAPAAGPLYVDGETAAMFGAVWGTPAESVQVVESSQRVDTLWQARPAWTILPFHQLRPELKVLYLDGVSPLQADFEASTYLLTIPIRAIGEPAAVEQFLAHYDGPTTNRDPNRLTFVAMTGPSGLDRAVGDRMERYGLTYPGEEIAPILAAADFAHMSNEVAFAPDCPHPEPVGDTQFCAQDEYLELMTFMSIDINEMTGNHVNDWGEHNLQHTFDLYEAAGILTFGGGRDLEQARAPLFVEHHGNRLAFVGCNPVGPYYAWAREEYGGSAPCEDYAFIKNQIAELDSQGYLVVATLQYLEHYQYDAMGTQQHHFRALAEAGATAVSGSQGHHAQGFDFHAGAFIHYGLGNLIFDQMQYRGTRQSFIDWYVFYDGRLISVELITGLIEDYARPRLMTAEERAELLEAVFEGSGWE
jgi:poly-gamma-glutamate synthesis protein (capsule biosynthesis protein)